MLIMKSIGASEWKWWNVNFQQFRTQLCACDNVVHLRRLNVFFFGFYFHLFCLFLFIFLEAAAATASRLSVDSTGIFNRTADEHEDCLVFHGRTKNMEWKEGKKKHEISLCDHLRIVIIFKPALFLASLTKTIVASFSRSFPDSRNTNRNMFLFF